MNRRFNDVGRPLAACLAVVLAAGCAVLSGPQPDKTRFFTLPTFPVSADQRTTVQPARLLIRRVDLPGYLQSKVFAVRGEGGQIHYVDGCWWSEPLDLGIARVVRERIQSVTGVPVAERRDGNYQYEMVIRINRFEGEIQGDKGMVRLDASIELLDSITGRSVLQKNTVASESWDGKNYDALALALGRQAAKIAELILANSPVAGSR